MLSICLRRNQTPGALKIFDPKNVSIRSYKSLEKKWVEEERFSQFVKGTVFTERVLLSYGAEEFRPTCNPSHLNLQITAKFGILNGICQLNMFISRILIWIVDSTKVVQVCTYHDYVLVDRLWKPAGIINISTYVLLTVTVNYIIDLLIWWIISTKFNLKFKLKAEWEVIKNSKKYIVMLC